MALMNREGDAHFLHRGKSAVSSKVYAKHGLCIRLCIPYEIHMCSLNSLATFIMILGSFLSYVLK